MIKAIFFDLDGTLLNSQKQIPEKTKAALQACKNQGIKLFVATARPPILDRMLHWTSKEFSLFDGGVYCNGGCERLADKVKYAFVPQPVVLHCIEEVKKYKGLHIALQMKNEMHAFNHPLADFAYQPWGIEQSDVAAVTNSCTEQTVKILIYYENIVDTVTPLPRALTEHVQQYCAARAKCYLTDQGKVLQIANRTASKYNSIENIRRLLGLDKSQIAVFGDDQNDIEMLLGYENAVAMGNADAQVKNAVRFVTKGNDEEGIPYALTELLHVL